MLGKLKYIHLSKQTNQRKKLKRLKNRSGRNRSGKLVIRFRSKSNVKAFHLLTLLNRTDKLVSLSRRSANLNSFKSSRVYKKDLLFLLSLLIQNFNFQVTLTKLKNFVFFIKRIYSSKRMEIKLTIFKLLDLIRSKLAILYQICMTSLSSGKIMRVIQSEGQELPDLGFVSNLSENTYVSNVSANDTRFFCAPGTRALILNTNSKNTWVLTPKNKVLKLQLKSTGQSSNVVFLRKTKEYRKKASLFKFTKTRPRVLGKNMNISDRPNGGYKHASKILKNYKSNLIKK